MADHRNHHTPPTSRFSLYNGRTREGYVVNSNGRWAAFTANNKSIGSFPSMAAACAAVAAAYVRSHGEAAA